MKRTQLKRSTPLKRTSALKRTASRPRRRGISPASTAQREKTREALSVVSGRPDCDPAHLLPRSLLTEGQDDPRAVIPLTRDEHGLYDTGRLDLLPYEPRFREEMAFAVQRFGLLRTLERVSNTRWTPINTERTNDAEDG